MNGNMFRGFSYLITGFQLIFQPGFKRYLLVPVSVNIALFALLIMWAKSLFTGGLAHLMAWIPEWLAFLEWLFWAIYFLAILMTIFYGFVAAANLLGAPFYGYLAEKAEAHLRGQEDNSNTPSPSLLAMIPRTLIRELQKILYYLPRVVVLMLLGLIPGLNAIIAVIWIMFSGWMMAIQYIDYPADNNDMSFTDMRRYLAQHRLSAFGFGSLTFAATLLPLLNLFALPAAVCGASAFWVRESQYGATALTKGPRSGGETPRLPTKH